MYFFVFIIKNESEMRGEQQRTLLSILFTILLFSSPISASASFSAPAVALSSENIDPLAIYHAIKQDTLICLPSFESFSLAMEGYRTLKIQHAGINKDILTLIDFSKPSNEKRLWIIDLKTGKVLIHDWVAHGKNSGNQFAEVFSNTPNSNTSSLGFYITGETYFGKHGLSLFLNGMDEGYNNNARKRAIVLHGADYVSEDFIHKYGRLGRSLGCPSVSMNIYKQVIDTICDGSCLFIYYPDQNFISNSSVLNPLAPVFSENLKKEGANESNNL